MSESHPKYTSPSYFATSSPHRYVFIEFRNAEMATHALNEMNGYPFDATHTFFVNRFTDIEKFADIDETYVEPQPEEYVAKVRLIPSRNFGSGADALQEHLRAWLADSLGRDQYVTYRGDEVSIRWHGRPSQCEVAYEDNVRTSLFGLISHSNLPDIAKPTNRIIRFVVTTRYIHRHPSPTRRQIIRRSLLQATRPLLPPSRPSHRLFALRAIPRNVVP